MELYLIMEIAMGKKKNAVCYNWVKQAAAQ